MKTPLLLWERAAARRNRLYLIFGAALLLRAGCVLVLPQEKQLTGDQVNYETIALNLAGGHGFSIKPGVATPSRAPLYPFLLAAHFKVFGHHYFVVRLSQAVLGALSCAVLFLMAKELFSERVASAAGWLLAVYPVLIVHTGRLLSETTFTFLFTLALLFLARFLVRRRTPDLILSAIVLAAATLTRPVILMFPFALLAAFLAVDRRLAGRWLLFLAVFAAAVLPWSLRNRVLFGVLAPASMGPGYGLFVTGHQAHGLALSEGHKLYLKMASEPRYQEPEVLVRGSSPLVELEARLKREGIALIRSRPGAYAWIVVKRLPRFWLTSHSSVFGVKRSLSEYRREGKFLEISVRLGLLLLHVLLWGLGLLGMSLSIENWRKALLLLLPLAYFTLHIGFDMIPRYHLPALPCLFVFAAVALCGLRDRMRRTASRR